MRTNTHWALLVLLLCVCLPGRGRAQTEEEDVGIGAPKQFAIPQGGTGYLTVSIDRKKWKGPVYLEIRGLPAGVVVKPAARVELKKDEEKSVDFTFLTGGSVEAKEYPIQLAVVGEQGEKKKSLPLEVRDFAIRGYGLLAMVLSVTAVLLLSVFCIFRVLTLPPTEEETLKGPLEIDTKDTQDAD